MMSQRGLSTVHIRQLPLKDEQQDNVKEVMEIHKTLPTTNVQEQLLIILDYTAGKFEVK